MRDDRDGGPLTLAYCWAHVRRKFLDVFKATKSESANCIIDLINQIYDIERDLKGKPATVRLSVRQREARPIITKLFDLLRKLSGEISMKSVLGAAIAYTMKLRDGPIVFLQDGRVEFDNNAVENTIRPIALLRKKALFAGSEIGGRNWALMASIIGTCRMNGVEPYAYARSRYVGSALAGRKWNSSVMCGQASYCVDELVNSQFFACLCTGASGWDANVSNARVTLFTRLSGAMSCLTSAPMGQFRSI